MKLSPKTKREEVGRPWIGAQLDSRNTGFLVRVSNARDWTFMEILSEASAGDGEAVARAGVQLEVVDGFEDRWLLALLRSASRRRWGGMYFAVEDMVTSR